MKKFLKAIGAIIAVFIVIFIILAVWGRNDSKKEEDLAKTNIDNEISFQGDFSELDTSKDWMGEHLIVSGKINTVDRLFITLMNDDFTIKAYCDDISDVAKAGIVTIDGVCTYQSSNGIRMRNCHIVDYKKPDIPDEKEEDSTINAEKDISAEVENEQTQEVDEKEQELTESEQEQDNIDIEEKEQEDIKKSLTEALGEDTLKSVEYSRADTIQISVYFERKSVLLSTDKLKKSVLDTVYLALKAYYEIVQENDDAPNVSVTACFPDDGKDHADEACYQVVCRLSDLDKFDFSSSDTSQMEADAYACKWLIAIK